ncbi:hypothetical protein EDF54_1612 [Rathayibacter sp. PhB93]|uniref:hypothetical protein n=1 Tax=unclassified Rathayibacter TaxID=2609250 RepID=UPI000F496168|nr:MULTISPECIES: hypothetical protein [unclassified Rathayibacter]ROQ06646.1 hypothetical protein EDF54_1612 [Rathayibacter sp. PhB93]TDQ14403.1 hypothetical protein EDF17_1431 [Rathayibacter sp. PhB1]
MTVQHEGAPLTRREIRERERAAAGAAPAAAPTTSRRAATASVTAAGEMPVLTATQALRVPVVAPTPAAEPELSTSAIEVVLPEGVDRSTLTRRELRALLAQQQAEQVAATPEAAPVDAAQDPAKAEPDAAEESAPEESPREEAAAEESAPEASAVEQPADELEQSDDEPEQPKLNTALFATVGTLDIADEKATEITGSFHPPIEHLAITDELDSKSKEEVDASFDSLIASGVASTGAVTTTNALILPTAGDASPVRTDTGEVLVTGSFDLPRSLGSTGQHPNLYDSPDVDRYVDRIDREQPASDSEPVRASSAVSTHAAGTAMIAPQKRRAVSVPVVLAITAAVLLVASIALFIGGFVLNIF